MKLGVVYPQIELRGDPQAVHDIGVGVEEMGFDHLLVYDHVVGRRACRSGAPAVGAVHGAGPVPRAARDVRLPRCGDLAHRAGDRRHDPAATPDGHSSPSRPTDADLLSRERLRLGVGTGWNYVEYDALGQEFKTRGARLDEQIELLRRLWAEPLVTFDGQFDRFDRACINPRPRRQIPIWIGGFAEPAYRRGGRLGDGFTFAGDVDAALQGMARVRHHLSEAGRSDEGFGLELIATRARSTGEIGETAERWQAAGGTHLSVLTMKLDLDTAAAHLEYVRLRRRTPSIPGSEHGT